MTVRGPSEETLKKIAEYKAGRSFREVAERRGCTVQNVNQLVQKHAPEIIRYRSFRSTRKPHEFKSAGPPGQEIFIVGICQAPGCGSPIGSDKPVKETRCYYHKRQK